MKKKIIRRQYQVHSSLSDALHPLLKRIYSARGIQSLIELERGVDKLLPYHTLTGVDAAVSCLAEAIFQQKKMLIIGDFDADGATSTALAIRILRSFGAKEVSYLVPNRFHFGYGLTPELMEVAKDLHPDVIITVDNGIANHAGVLAAKALGMQVVITDHHLPGETLPPADAIVNPNQGSDLFPSKCIAGVGVIFYVLLALRRYLVSKNWFKQNNLAEPNMTKYLDLVALGTVADVVSLDQNNRIMVYQGLQRIRAGLCVPGVLALLEIANRDHRRIIATDLGFSVAPRLNAAGRLDDMSLGIECLLTDDLQLARNMAKQLEELNNERRLIENNMQTQAFSVLNNLPIKQDSGLMGVCLFDENWHQGVIGILAARIKDKLHRPVIAFAPASGEEIKGSARSISGFHIRDALAGIDVRYPHLISKFGGHAMAAGLTMQRSSFPTFAKVFDEYVSHTLKSDDLNYTLWSDGELSGDDLSLEGAEVIRDAGPWGQSFPEPVFDGLFKIIDQRLVAAKHLKMVLKTDEKLIDAIAFNVDINKWPNYRTNAIHAAYRLDINEFRDSKKLQLIIEALEEA